MCSVWEDMAPECLAKTAIAMTEYMYYRGMLYFCAMGSGAMGCLGQHASKLTSDPYNLR